MRLSERLAKLEKASGVKKPGRRVELHILDCAPEEREARIAAIEAADTDAFHIVNVIIEPAENGIGR